MKHKFILIVLSLFAIQACQDYSQPILIEKENFKLRLPGFVKEEELAEDAVLEYANRYRNFYIVVLKSVDSVSKDSLWRLNTTRISSALLKPKIDSTHQESDIISTITGSFKDEKEPLFYTQKLIYRPGNSLIITVWTRGKERKKRYEAEITDIIQSFKLTNETR